MYLDGHVGLPGHSLSNTFEIHVVNGIENGTLCQHFNRVKLVD